ncbi:MAG: hypothetical protein ACTSSG_10665 [Candidatus Heimdallarchaeaceae archaeon]
MTTKHVVGAGGIVTIHRPIGSSTEYTWNTSYPIHWTVDADSGYTIVSVQTKENGVVIRTDYPDRNNNTENSAGGVMSRDWSESNPGLGPNNVYVTATFTKLFSFYYESDGQSWHSTGTIYKERFNSIGNWVLSTYDGDDGDENNREEYYDSGCSGGTAYVEEDTGYTQSTYVLLIDNLDLSDWSKYGDITFKIKLRATGDSSSDHYTNTQLNIWGSGGDPLDYYFYQYTNEATTDTRWITRSHTLNNEDFDTLTSLTIAFGFKDSAPGDYNVKVDVEYIEIHWEVPT